MKLQSINNNINFQKTLRANCKVLNEKREPCPCGIYELDAYDDRDYFKSLLLEKNWKNAEYLDFVDTEMRYIHEEPECRAFVLENEKGNCLGFAISTNGRQNYSIDILETAPRYKNDIEGVDGKYKYVGETLVSFLTKDAIRNKRNFIDVDAAYTATGFYEKTCGFDYYDPDYDEMYLHESNFQQLINKNEKDTKGTIDIIA